MLKSGINLLIDQYSTLDSGINEYTDSVTRIVAGYESMANGMNTLGNGSQSLLKGTGTLKEGTSSLYDGINTLQNESIQLSNGTKEFYEKTTDMDVQVSDQISDMISFMQGKDGQIMFFTSSKNEHVKSVQFVIKTSCFEKKNHNISKSKTIHKTSIVRKLFGL